MSQEANFPTRLVPASFPQRRICRSNTPGAVWCRRNLLLSAIPCNRPRETSLPGQKKTLLTDKNEPGRFNSYSERAIIHHTLCLIYVYGKKLTALIFESKSTETAYVYMDSSLL